MGLWPWAFAHNGVQSCMHCAYAYIIGCGMSSTFLVQDVMKSGESFHLWPFLDEIKCTYYYGERPRGVPKSCQKVLLQFFTKSFAFWPVTAL